MVSEIEAILEKLVAERNSLGKRIITGFNHYSTCLDYKEYTILTLSQVHESQRYLSAVQEYLQLNHSEITFSTRDKRGYFKWGADFFFRDKEGTLEKDLKIKNIETKEFLDFESIPYRTLAEAGFTEEEVAKLVAQNKGYEVNLFFPEDGDILRLVPIFIRKSSSRAFNEEGFQIPETKEEYEERGPWPDAHSIPTIIIGGRISQIKEKVSGFREASLYRFQDKELGEYYFVINKMKEALKTSREYELLVAGGFTEESCLANIPFLNIYVDCV